MLRLNSASTYDDDEEPSPRENDGNGHLYTVPQNRENENNTTKDDIFGENLGNNGAANEVVMDDIIGHMATPMGDDENKVLMNGEIEMEDVHTNHNGDGDYITKGNSDIELADDEFVINGDEDGNGYGNEPDDDIGVDIISNEPLKDDIDNNLVNEVDSFVITAGNIDDIEDNDSNGTDNDILDDVNLYTPGEEDGNDEDQDDENENIAMNDLIETMQ